MGGRRATPSPPAEKDLGCRGSGDLGLRAGCATLGYHWTHHSNGRRTHRPYEKNMNPFLRDRIVRSLETMSDERAYQVLDYVEFLESKYAVRPTLATTFQRFAETVEDTLRAGRVPATAVAETMTFLNRAVGVLNGVAAAGKSVANDLVQAATKPTSSGPSASSGEQGAPPALPRNE
jgi:hypothetical protein